MTSVKDNDIREACVKIDFIIEELPKYFVNPPLERIIRGWILTKENLIEYINKEQVVTTSYYGRVESHFKLSVWARPGVCDGPD